MEKHLEMCTPSSWEGMINPVGSLNTHLDKTKLILGLFVETEDSINSIYLCCQAHINLNIPYNFKLTSNLFLTCDTSITTVFLFPIFQRVAY